MELFIAKYLVENGFANDIVSALKILYSASDDWYDELLNENITRELSDMRRQIQQLTQRGKPVPPAMRAKAAELARQVRASANIGAELNRGKTNKNKVPGSGSRPQKPEMRDPRLGPTRQQRQADTAATRMVGSVERGATVIRRNPDGTTTRVSANFTRDPINVRSDATRRERRSGSSRTTERPEFGRWSQSRSAENAPRSFRRGNR